MSKVNITYLDLFAGTGAFAKGLLDAGFRFSKHYFSEVDRHAIANYSYNFKHAKNLGDVTKIKTKKLQRPDIITFGSPCQDISHAGKRKGIHGQRSQLFFRAVDLINRLRPQVFVFENVKGLLFNNQEKNFEIILREIANLGLYECQWQLVHTGWFLPQNRERLFLVGSLRGYSPPKVFPLISGYQKKKKREAKVKLVAKSGNGMSGRIFSPEGMAPTLMTDVTSNGLLMVDKKLRRLTPVECERLQGLPDNWTKFGIYDNQKKEISDGQRCKLLGNAITSLIMKKIGKQLLPLFNSSLNGFKENQLEKIAYRLYEKLLKLNSK